MLKEVYKEFLNKGILEEKKLKELFEIIKLYSGIGYLYPGSIMINLKVSAYKAYEILSILEMNDVVSKSYEEYCNKCDNYNTRIYNEFSNIPDKFYCGNCKEKLDCIEDTVLLFRINNTIEL